MGELEADQPREERRRKQLTDDCLKRGKAACQRMHWNDELARNVAVQWAPSNIRVNAVLPSLIDTEFFAGLVSDDVFMERRRAATPLRCVGSANEVADAIAFLASPAATFVTGHNLVVDGGAVISDGC